MPPSTSSAVPVHTGLVTGEEQDAVGPSSDFTQRPSGMRLVTTASCSGVRFGRHARQGRTGTHAVDADVVGRQFEGRVVGEAHRRISTALMPPANEMRLPAIDETLTTAPPPLARIGAITAWVQSPCRQVDVEHAVPRPRSCFPA